MNERLWGEITALAYLVQRGKPASSIAIKSIHAKDVEEFIKSNYSLKVYFEDLSEGWLTLWIYKYPHILNVITSLNSSPQSVFDHWVQGKLFGFEEAAIDEFLNLTTAESSVRTTRARRKSISVII